MHIPWKIKSLHLVNNMSTILATDFGTYCDFKLMTELLYYLEMDGHRIVYVTARDNKVSNKLSEAVHVIRYDNVSQSQMDTAIEMADSSANPLSILQKRLMRGGALIDTDKLMETLKKVRMPFSQLATALNELDHIMGVLKSTFSYIEVLEKAIRESHPVVVLVHYAALCQLFSVANKEDFKNIAFIVVFFAPGYPNNKTYWLFDSRLRHPKKDIYDTRLRAEYKQSHLQFAESLKVCRNGVISVAKSWMLRMGMKESIKEVSSDLKKCGLFSRLMGRQMEAFVNSLDSIPVDWEIPPNVYGLKCWDPEVLPDIPVATVIKNAPVIPMLANSRPIGGIISRDTVANPTVLPVGLKDFMQRSISAKGTLVYLSFGSFNLGDDYDMENFMMALMTCANRLNLFIICHSQKMKDLACDSQLSENLLIIVGHIAHEWLLPRCNLVLTTGSYCLLNVCMLYQIKCLFFPILPEQFFWAKNYQHQTDIPYFDYQNMLVDLSTDEIVLYLYNLLQSAMMGSIRQKEYLSRVSVSLQNTIAQNNLVNIVRSMFIPEIFGGKRYRLSKEKDYEMTRR